MTRSDQWKFYLTVVFVLASVWTLWPTFQFYSLSPTERQQVLQARPTMATNETERLTLEKYAKLRDKAIKLGLDLQGGMYLLLEVDTSKLGPAPPSTRPCRSSGTAWTSSAWPSPPSSGRGRTGS